MLTRVRDTLYRHRMLEGVSVVGVAVSGGADSVCLLHVLHELAPELGVSLAVLHLNHGLRGEESASDAEWVAALAAGLGIPAYISNTNVRDTADNLEQAGRRARREFFASVRRDHAIDRVATAHTLSDQAETVLYRLLRGSGTAGLRGILPVTRDGIIRPLLECSRAEVESWLAGRGLAWREDRTNRSPEFVRNRIRHHLLPVLAHDYNPAVSQVLAATAELARDEEDWWKRRMDRLAAARLVKTSSGVVLEAAALVDLHPAEARRLIRRAIEEAKGDLRGIEIPHIERIRELAALAQGHGRMQAPGLDVFRSFEWLRIGPLRTESRFAGDYCWPVALPSDGHPDASVSSFQVGETAIFLEIRRLGDRTDYNKGTDELDTSLLRDVLELRNWRPGDEFQPVGRAKTKIKTLFQEGRVPIWERHKWPVLVSGSDIVWTRRFGAAERVVPGARTSTVLRVYESVSGPHGRAGSESRESKEPGEASN